MRMILTLNASATGSKFVTSFNSRRSLSSSKVISALLFISVRASCRCRSMRTKITQNEQQTCEVFTGFTVFLRVHDPGIVGAISDAQMASNSFRHWKWHHKWDTLGHISLHFPVSTEGNGASTCQEVETEIVSALPRCLRFSSHLGYHVPVGFWEYDMHLI